ncbi:UNVERIFIED_CONTAM: hypothetical protein K2H54_050006 [Gekko kuhli]
MKTPEWSQRSLGSLLKGTLTTAIILVNLAFVIAQENVQTSNSLEEGVDVTAHWWGLHPCGGGEGGVDWAYGPAVYLTKSEQGKEWGRKAVTGLANKTCTGTSKRYQLCKVQLQLQTTIPSSLGAVADEAGYYFFNGNYRVDSPKNFNIAGTVFKYRRPMDIYETGIEYIVAQGPTNQGVNIMVWNQNGKNPSITYEYTLLKRPHLKNAQPVYYTFSESDSEESREFDGEEPLGFIQHNASFFGTNSKEKIRFENQVLERQDSTEDLDLSKIQETNEVYERTEANACTPVLRNKQPKDSNTTKSSYMAERGGREFDAQLVSKEFLSENAITHKLLDKTSDSKELAWNKTANSILSPRDPANSVGPHLLDSLYIDDDDHEEVGPYPVNGTFLELSSDKAINTSSETLFPNATISAASPSGNRTHKAR